MRAFYKARFFVKTIQQICLCYTPIMETNEERDVTNAKVDTVGSVLAAKIDGFAEVTKAQLANVQTTTTRLERNMDTTTTKVADIQQKVSVSHEHAKSVDESLKRIHANVKILFDRTEPIEGVEKQVDENTRNIKDLQKRRIMQDALLPLGFFITLAISIISLAKLLGLI